MDTKAMTYFSSMNPLARKIVTDTQMVEKMIGEKWETFDVNEQEETLNDFFVRPEVRLTYDSQKKGRVYPESFPKLNIQSGEKIIIDDANDFWTWQDEHSAPFSWKSKSQQDLSLLDLDELSKSGAKTSKTKKPSDEESSGFKMAKQEFKYSADKKSLWQDLFPQKLAEFGRDSSGNDTEFLINKEVEVSKPEWVDTQVNRHGKGLNGNLNLIHGKEVDRNVKSTEVLSDNPQPKLKVTKSPVKSPKLTLSSSFSKKKQGDSESLVTKQTLPKSKSNSSVSSREEEEELNAFDNPLMSSGVSSLVQDEEDYSSSNASSPSRRPLLREPRGQSIGRDVTPPYTSTSVCSKGDDHALLRNEGFVNSELHSFADSSKGSSEDLNDSNIPITGFDFLDTW